MMRTPPKLQRARLRMSDIDVNENDEASGYNSGMDVAYRSRNLAK